MNALLRLATIALASLPSLLCSPKVQGAPASPPKFAVLVGITKYRQPGVIKLEGCLNDVRDMRQRLISNFGFTPQNILVLKNESASRANIVSAIRTQLRDKAKQYPTGTFLFYYSGHGSQTPDKNGDERLNAPTDTYDETFVTYDKELVDDDLDLLCNEVRTVPQFSGSLTVISDSCHSGTNTRSTSREGEPHVRSAPADPARNATPLAPQGTTGKEKPTGNLVAFSGCLSSQTSQEDAFPTRPTQGKTANNTEYHGVMTYHLLQAMDNAIRTTTNDQIWTQLASALSGKYNQLPQLEGGRTGQAFLGGALKTIVPPITYSLTADTLTFPKGVEAGAVSGGFVALYNNGSKKAELPITSTAFGKTTVKIPPALKLAAQGTVELLTPYFGSDPLKIGLGPGISADNPVVQRLKNKYNSSNNKFVRLAQNTEKPSIYLMRFDRRSAFNDTPKQPDASDGKETQQGYFFAIASGQPPLFGVFLPITNTDDIVPSDEANLFSTAENYAAQCNVKTLTNHIRGKVTAKEAVTITTVRANGSFDEKGGWNLDTNNPTPVNLNRDQLRTGQGIRFNFQNQTSKSLYISVLWLSDDGSISAIEDTRYRKQFVLAPRSRPGDSSSEDRASSQYCSIEGKTGTDTIKVFISTKPINVWYLERDSITTRNSNAPTSPFDMIAGQALGTRAPQPNTDKPEFQSWDTQTMTITIAPEKTN
ncbi:caspase family protein [bacterium]|nr:MAG: caspase family protein [bacterium]